MRLTQRNKKLMRQLKKLLGSPVMKLEDLSKKRNGFNLPVVYIISKPNSKKVVYAGRTITGNLRKRMSAHKNLEQSSDLKKMIKGKKDYPQKAGEYGVRHLKIEDAKKRMYLEDFAIAILQPSLNKEGKNFV